MQKHIITIFSLFFFVQCNYSSHKSERDRLQDEVVASDTLTIITSNYKEKDDTIRVTQFIDSLFYIPLEKNEECTIQDIGKVLMTNTYIFILDNSGDLYMFRREAVRR